MVIYKPTRKGIEFCTNILEPYEKVFPRRKTSISVVFNNIYQEDKGKELTETKNKALAKNAEE
jgi:hypothetical protein